MEDQKRGMDPPEKIIPPAERGHHRVRDLTVMVIRGVGKVYSFKISPHTAFWAGLFFLIYIPASIFIIHKHFDLHRKHVTQSKRIVLLEKEFSEGKKSIHRFEQHIAVLKDYIANLEKRRERENVGAPAKGEDLRDRRAALNLGNGPRDRDEGEFSANVVDVKDMVIRREESRVTVDFKLVNTRPGEKVVRGYLHIIAMGENADPPPEWTYPKERIENGFPWNFRRGHLFLIKSFKPIHRKFDLLSDSEYPTAVKVLVYDRAGMLILKKEFEVSNAS